MARYISKGTCTFCQRTLSKSSMTRHLAACEQRAAIPTEAGSNQNGQKSCVFHLIVQGYRLPLYWIHLEVRADLTLANLDRFLRGIWLECCDHLSAFEIGGVRYTENAGIFGWNARHKSIQVHLDNVLNPGQTCSYEYDFGSTTELTIKVVSEREVETQGKPIQILARNILPPTSCNICGKPATFTCMQCIYKDQGYLCDECMKNHICREGILLLIANSPRAGVCGYTGWNSAYVW